MNTTYWLNKVMSTMYTDSGGEFYLGLSSSLPTSDGSNVKEPGGSNYERVKISGFSEPDNGVVKNTAALEFPRSTGVWFDSENKAKYWVLFDGSTPEAHVLSSGELDEAKTIESNTTITVDAETLSITLTDYVPGRE